MAAQGDASSSTRLPTTSRAAGSIASRLASSQVTSAARTLSSQSQNRPLYSVMRRPTNAPLHPPPPANNAGPARLPTSMNANNSNSDVSARIMVSLSNLITILQNQSTNLQGLEARFKEQDKRYSKLEERFGNLEEGFRGVEKRFEGVETHVSKVKEEVVSHLGDSGKLLMNTKNTLDSFAETSSKAIHTNLLQALSSDLTYLRTEASELRSAAKECSKSVTHMQIVQQTCQKVYDNQLHLSSLPKDISSTVRTAVQSSLQPVSAFLPIFQQTLQHQQQHQQQIFGFLQSQASHNISYTSHQQSHDDRRAKYPSSNKHRQNPDVTGRISPILQPRQRTQAQQHVHVSNAIRAFPHNTLSVNDPQEHDDYDEQHNVVNPLQPTPPASGGAAIIRSSQTHTSRNVSSHSERNGNRRSVQDNLNGNRLRDLQRLPTEIVEEEMDDPYIGVDAASKTVAQVTKSSNIASGTNNTNNPNDAKQPARFNTMQAEPHSTTPSSSAAIQNVIPGNNDSARAIVRDEKGSNIRFVFRGAIGDPTLVKPAAQQDITSTSSQAAPSRVSTAASQTLVDSLALRVPRKRKIEQSEDEEVAGNGGASNDGTDDDEELPTAAQIAATPRRNPKQKQQTTPELPVAPSRRQSIVPAVSKSTRTQDTGSPSPKRRAPTAKATHRESTATSGVMTEDDEKDDEEFRPESSLRNSRRKGNTARRGRSAGTGRSGTARLR